MSDRWRYVLLVTTMALLLVPRGVTSAIAAIVLVFPVAVTGVRGRDQAFFCWAAYVLSFVAFAYLRDAADAIGPGPFISYPIEADRSLGMGTVPTIALQAWYHPAAPRWWDFAGLGIYLSYFVSVPVVGVIVWRRRPQLLQPFLLGMVGVFLVSAVVHLLVPTAPPWVAAQVGQLPTVYRPVVDLLGGLAPGVYEYGLSIAGGNDVAAMPSVHAAAAAMIAMAAKSARVAWAGGGYATLMGLTLIYFGEHYVVDVLAGALLALACWHVGGAIEVPFGLDGRSVPPR